jgi:DMSO reductase anchor subunit/ferredoxin
MIACPVNAYEKDPVTGIVKHLDDQCFGCQYCTLACPYDVPKYHAGKGIVRKCDMCSSRLAIGEPPACVQACPSEAIAIRLVKREQVLGDAEASNFLPAAPDPQITYPTTTYKTRKPFPSNLLPADYTRVNPQHAHWPLIVMLVLTQLSVGAFTVGLLLEHWVDQQLLATLLPLHAATALGFGLLALGASLLHLGRPHLAFRAILGLRHSWLSREIVAFGTFAALALLYSITVFVTHSSAVAGAVDAAHPPWVRWLGWSVAVSGGAAVFCSTMIYAFTQRECWSFPRVCIRFSLTCGVLGVAAIWLSMLASTFLAPHATVFALVRICGPVLCRTLVALVITKLVIEAADFRHLLSRKMTPLKRSALLMTRELSNPTLARFALGVLGGIILSLMLANRAAGLSDGASFIEFAVMSGLLFTACLGGELLERYLFFTSCAAPRMPGGIR